MTGTGGKRLVCLCLLSLETFTVQGGWWDSRFDLAGANGTIGSLVEFRGGVYAVGGFTRISGVDAPDALARWDGTNWVAIQPGLNASVTAAVATDQAIYFAADQARSDQQPTGLLRWDGQTWTALGAPPGYRDVLGAGLRLNGKDLYGSGSQVPPWAGADTLMVNGTDIYAQVAPAVVVNGVTPILAAAKWDGNSWSTLAETGYLPLAGFAVAQGNLYAAGFLYLPGAPSALNLGRLVQTNWVSVDGGVGQGESLFGIATDGTNLFVNGSFLTAGSLPADGFAIWDSAQWMAPSAALRDGLAVKAMTSNPGEVLASEALTRKAPCRPPFSAQQLVQYRGTNRTVLARGDADAGMGLMKRFHDGVYCAGGFRSVGGVPTGNLSLWTGSNWARVGNGSLHGLTAQATTLAVSGTNVYAAGAFEYAGEVAARQIARWDGRAWHPLGSGIEATIAPCFRPQPPVVQMAASGSDLFVIGTFTAAGGVAATNVARWDGTNWSALGAGLSGELTAIATAGNQVLVARTIAETNFAISRWDGAAWSDVAGGSFFDYGEIKTMLTVGDSILVGGTFAAVNGVEMNNVALWDGSQWRSLGGGLRGQAAPIAPVPPELRYIPEVRALLVDGTNVYAGGSFTNAGGVAATNVARWDGNTWSPLGAGIPGAGYCFLYYEFHPITSLALVQGKLFAGGGFFTGSPVEPSRGLLAQWDGTSWTEVGDSAWSLDSGQLVLTFVELVLQVSALAGSGSDLYVAGNFGTVANTPSYGFAIWHEGNPPALKARFRDGRLVLSWPAQFQYAAVEVADSLPSTVWRPVAGLNSATSGSATNDVEVTLLPSTSQAFYRLRL